MSVTCKGCEVNLTWFATEDDGAWVANAPDTSADGLAYCPPPDPDTGTSVNLHVPFVLVSVEVLDPDTERARLCVECWRGLPVFGVHGRLVCERCLAHVVRAARDMLIRAAAYAS